MILDFLRDNWRFVVEVCLLVISTLVVILKKKATININSTELSAAVESVPKLIIEAETIFGPGSGEEKLYYVLDQVCSNLAQSRGISVKELPGSFIVNIKDFIEMVLSTPKKKEVFPCIKED